MNHVEALKMTRDALENIHDAPSVDVWSAVQATQALAATAVIDPAASIVNPTYIGLMIQHHKCRLDADAEQDAWGALIQHIDAHCAAQVAQALAANPAPTDAEITSMWMRAQDQGVSGIAPSIFFARALLAR